MNDQVVIVVASFIAGVCSTVLVSAFRQERKQRQAARRMARELENGKHAWLHFKPDDDFR